MTHNILLDGYGCQMRPATREDAEFIIKLRNMPHAKGYIGDTFQSIQKQQDWLDRYFERNNDYYWIVLESETGRLVGTYGLYDIKDGIGVPGRWVIMPGACFSVLATTLLVFQFAFEKLELNKLVFTVVSSNNKVLKFYRLLRVRETQIEYNAQIINGGAVDLIRFELTKQEWPAMYAKWNFLIR